MFTLTKVFNDCKTGIMILLEPLLDRYLLELVLKQHQRNFPLK